MNHRIKDQSLPILWGVFAAAAVCAAELPDTANDSWWKEERIARVSIYVSAEGLSSLRKDPRQKVSATVRFDQEPVAETGLHLKGSVGSFRPIDGKPGFTLTSAKDEPGTGFHGANKIHLNNSVEDPTYLNEEIGCLVFAKAGIPTPRTRHALVELNGRRLGLYVLKEGFTRSFLGRHFQDGSGELYDGHPPLNRSDEDSAAPDRDDGGLTRVNNASAIPDATARWTELQKLIDLDQFISFMAIEVLICHRDGYCLARNNYRLYHDPSKDQFIFLPQGMDQLFGRPDLSWRLEMAGPVARAIISTPPGRGKYRERLQSLARDLDASGLVREIDRKAPLLRKEMARSERGAFDEALLSLKSRIIARKALLVDQLNQPERQPLVFTNGIAQPGDWKPFDAPSHGVIREQTSPNEVRSLYILAGPSTASSWRAKALLAPGSYRFEGMARTEGVAPLLFGKNQGARLRIAGNNARPIAGLLGNHEWTRCLTEFTLAEEQEVELICELRARRGEVWFDRQSLKLVTLKK